MEKKAEAVNACLIKTSMGEGGKEEKKEGGKEEKKEGGKEEKEGGKKGVGW